MFPDHVTHCNDLNIVEPEKAAHVTPALASHADTTHHDAVVWAGPGGLRPRKEGRGDRADRTCAKEAAPT